MSAQGSASYTIVIGAIAAIIVGAIVLTMLFYPIVVALMGAAFWSSQTSQGALLTTYVGGIWRFWGAIVLMAILSFVWIRTRQ